jgi:hypothetical protein
MCLQLSYFLSVQFSTYANGVPPTVVRLVKPLFEELIGCVLSFRCRATQRASAQAARTALLLFPRLVLRLMVDFTYVGHLTHYPVADYLDNRITH